MYDRVYITGCQPLDTERKIVKETETDREIGTEIGIGGRERKRNAGRCDSL